MAGDKFQATQTERECLAACKRATECQAMAQVMQETDEVPECIKHCREQCNGRKDAVVNMLGRSTAKSAKAAARKKENTEKRAEHREQLKEAQPAPMIKELHEIRDEGDQVADEFLKCLKVKKPLLGCEELPKGPGELWDCKRDMVEQCLDENEDHYTQMGSEELVQFINDFEESEIVSENTRDYLQRQAEQAKLMQNDVQFEPEPKIVTLDEKYQMNKKGKVRVGFVRKLKGEAKDNVDTTAFGSDAGAQAYLDSLKEAKEPVEQETEEEVEEEALAQLTSHLVENPVDAGFEGGFSFDGFDDFSFEGMSNDFVGEGEEEEEDAELEEAEEEPEEKPAKKGGHRGGKKGPKGKKPPKKAKAPPKALFTLTSTNSDGQDTEKQATITSKGHEELKRHHNRQITQERFNEEMCRCRTSMDHYHVNNYLHAHGELDDWEHTENLCKWCAYPNSKKCKLCMDHWAKAANSANNNAALRTRNQVIEMSCLVFKRQINKGNFHSIHGKNSHNPCPRSKVHDGKFNSWQTDHQQAQDRFAKYHAMKNQ